MKINEKDIIGKEEVEKGDEEFHIFITAEFT